MLTFSHCFPDLTFPVFSNKLLNKNIQIFNLNIWQQHRHDLRSPEKLKKVKYFDKLKL